MTDDSTTSAEASETTGLATADAASRLLLGASVFLGIALVILLSTVNSWATDETFQIGLRLASAERDA